MSRPDLEESLAGLQRVQRTLAFTMMDRLSEHDLTIRQLKALHAVGDCEELTVGALGERLGVKLPAASIHVEHLVQAGLLDRHEDPDDRRRVRLSLTPRGQEIVQGRREIAAALRRWLGKMPEDDLRAFRRGIAALADIAAGPGSGRTDPEQSRQG